MMKSKKKVPVCRPCLSQLGGENANNIKVWQCKITSGIGFAVSSVNTTANDAGTFIRGCESNGTL